MKKLLIALTAAVVGVFASTATADEALPTGVGFDDVAAESSLVIDGYWTDSADVGATKVVKAWGDGEWPEGIAHPQTAGGTDANYLSLKTTFGNPIFRKAFTSGAPTVADGKIFFDSMVKFTATDCEPEMTAYAGSKLMVYVIDNSEDDSTTAYTTNLMVVANNADGEQTTYDLGTIDVDVWHRLTIKAVQAFTENTALAFTVYVDQQPRYVATPIYTDTSSLTTTAKGINAAGRLFPSLESCTTITEVGFDGQGCIDDLAFADSLIDETWADERAFALTKGENITSFDWVCKSGSETVASGTATDTISIPWVANMTVEISNPDFAAGQWKLAAEGLSEGLNFANNIFTGFGPSSSEAKLIAEDTTPRVSVTIDEGNPQTFPSIAKAFEAINALESGDVRVAFDKQYFTDGKIKPGTYIVEEVPYNEAALASGADVTIDLAGCTIEGPDDYTGCALESSGNLTIVDTVGGGKIVPVEGNAGAVMYLANLEIGGGIFDGALVTGDGETMAVGTITAITDGKFLVKPNFTPAEGKTWKQDANEYWYIADADRAQIGTEKYATLGDAITAAKDGDEIKLLLNSTEGGSKFAIGVSKYTTKGLTIDLNGKTLTFDADAVANAENQKDCITINTNNIVTIKNGTIAVAATGANGKATAFRDVIRYYAHADYDTLNLNGVTFNCANIPLKDGENHPCAPLQIEGGNVTFTNVAFSNVAEGGYTLKFGNHSNATQYKMGTYTFDDDTAAGLVGNVLIAGGTFVGAAKFVESDAMFFYGKNVFSSWDDAVYAPFAARYGLDLAAATGAEDRQLGQLYFSARAAVEAYQGDEETTGKELVVFGELTLADEFTISIPVKAGTFDQDGCDCYIEAGAKLVTKTTGLEKTIEPGTTGDYEIKASAPDTEGWITYTCEEKSVGPQPVDPEQGTIEKEEDGSYSVKPADGVKVMTLTGVSEGDWVNVPTSLDSISGVAGANIVVKNATGTVIPTAAFVGGTEGTFSLALNENAVVTVGSEQIPVKPALTEATDDTKPLVVGDTVAVGVKAIPGLTYSLMRSAEVGGEKASVASTVAEGARVSLTDPMQGGKPEKAFYVIQVAK